VGSRGGGFLSTDPENQRKGGWQKNYLEKKPSYYGVVLGGKDGSCLFPERGVYSEEGASPWFAALHAGKRKGKCG